MCVAVLSSGPLWWIAPPVFLAPRVRDLHGVCSQRDRGHRRLSSLKHRIGELFVVLSALLPGPVADMTCFVSDVAPVVSCVDVRHDAPATNYVA